MTEAERSGKGNLKDARADARAVAGAGAVTILFGLACVAVGLYAGWLAFQEDFRDLHAAWDMVVWIVAGIALTHLGSGILVKSRLCLILAIVVTALTAGWQVHAAVVVGMSPVHLIGRGVGPLITLVLLASVWGAMGRLSSAGASATTESPADATTWQELR